MRSGRIGLCLAGITLAMSPSLGNAAVQDAHWQQVALAAARALHAQTWSQTCELAPDRLTGSLGEVSYPLWFGEDGAQRDALLVQFPCRLGAYNQSSVFILADQNGVASELFFPSPQIDARYREGDGGVASETLHITGTVESREIVNARYDPNQRVVESYDKWRGLGDAYSLTRWGFKNARFHLMYYAVDATYDEQDNPSVLLNEDIW